jgi:hypothetical protein
MIKRFLDPKAPLTGVCASRQGAHTPSRVRVPRDTPRRRLPTDFLVIRHLISLPAGLGKMKYGKFIPFTISKAQLSLFAKIRDLPYYFRRLASYTKLLSNHNFKQKAT